MKIKTIWTLALLCGLTMLSCVTTPAVKPKSPAALPPAPPGLSEVLKKPARIMTSPKAGAETEWFSLTAVAPKVSAAAAPAPVVPEWHFLVNGDYYIEASTDLNVWWKMAVVYNVTNIHLISDTTEKKQHLFYRIRPQ